ncbi:hypothetical protein CPB85DRAFT_1254354 [Mucidula mucida]|nr:hypothetical protein CPB85DRAFT_1254354 [Mucidula mucida]
MGPYKIRRTRASAGRYNDSADGSSTRGTRPGPRLDFERPPERNLVGDLQTTWPNGLLVRVDICPALSCALLSWHKVPRQDRVEFINAEGDGQSFVTEYSKETWVTYTFAPYFQKTLGGAGRASGGRSKPSVHSGSGPRRTHRPSKEDNERV